MAARGGRSPRRARSSGASVHALLRLDVLDVVGQRVGVHGAIVEPDLYLGGNISAPRVLREKLLREEGRELRQQLAAKADENARLAEKLAAAKARIEALLKQIPETEA